MLQELVRWVLSAVISLQFALPVSESAHDVLLYSRTISGYADKHPEFSANNDPVLNHQTCREEIDMQIVFSDAFYSNFMKCHRASWSRGQQMKKCMGDLAYNISIGPMVKTYQLGDGCASCFVEYDVCAAEHCGLLCRLNPTSLKCTKCALDKCSASLSTCSGLDPLPPHWVIESGNGTQPVDPDNHHVGFHRPTGGCTSDNDLAVVWAPTFKNWFNLYFYCSTTTLGYHDPLKKCLSSYTVDINGTKRQYSDQCLTCWADGGTCAIANCKLPCVFNMCGEQCLKCNREKCQAPLHCSRLKDPPSPCFDNPKPASFDDPHVYIYPPGEGPFGPCASTPPVDPANWPWPDFPDPCAQNGSQPLLPSAAIRTRVGPIGGERYAYWGFVALCIAVAKLQGLGVGA